MSRVFPPEVPAQECLIRWGDPCHLGTLAHYHLWNTQATESARAATTQQHLPRRDARLWQLARDLQRRLPRQGQSVSRRRRGLRGDGAAGRSAARRPTACSRPPATAVPKPRLSRQPFGVDRATARHPDLHGHFMLLYRNGGLFRNIMEDLEQPNNDTPSNGSQRAAKAISTRLPSGSSSWMTTRASARSAQRSKSSPRRAARSIGPLTLERTNAGPATARPTHFANIFDFVNAANDASTNTSAASETAPDIENGCASSPITACSATGIPWGLGVSQNMFLFKQPGLRWKIMPVGTSTSCSVSATAPATASWGGQDPRLDVIDTPAFRRMLWRAYRDAVNGPMLPENYGPQIEARRAAPVVKNAITNWPPAKHLHVASTRGGTSSSPRLNANDAAQFAITSNGGRDFSSTRPTTTLAGTAPFAVATIEVNGIPYYVNWTDQRSFSITIPLTQPSNLLTLVGKDRLGNAVAGASDTITVAYTGAIQQPQDFVPCSTNSNTTRYAANASLPRTVQPLDDDAVRSVELPPARRGLPSPRALIQANSFLVLAKDRAAFTAAYGATIGLRRIPRLARQRRRTRRASSNPARLQPKISSSRTCVTTTRCHGRRTPPALGPSLQLIDAAQDDAASGIGPRPRPTT